MNEPSQTRAAEAETQQSAERPQHRPVERFWPYVELSESHSAAELAALDPDICAVLFGRKPIPFSITLVFEPFEGPDYEQALALARASAEYRETGAGPGRKHRARFFPSEALELRDLFSLVSRFDSCEVLIDDRPVPYARELWLPLVWFLIIK